MVPKAVRAVLIEPAGLAGVRIARENPLGPAVVAQPLLVVPGGGVRSALEDQVEVWIIRQPAPDRAATDLPLFALPALYPEVGPLVLRVEGFELRRVDEDVLVGSGVIGSPRHGAVRGIERRQPAAHAKLG